MQKSYLLLICFIYVWLTDMKCDKHHIRFISLLMLKLCNANGCKLDVKCVKRDVSDSKSLVQGCWTPPADFLSSVFVSLSRRTSPNGVAGDPKLPADGTIISLWGRAPTESLSANIVRLLLTRTQLLKFNNTVSRLRDTRTKETKAEKQTVEGQFIWMHCTAVIKALLLTINK